MCHSASTWEQIVSARFSILSRVKRFLVNLVEIRCKILILRNRYVLTNKKESACNQNVVLVAYG